MTSETPSPSAAPAPTTDERPTILVADDYPENRRLLYFYLRDAYRILEAESAEEAIETLRNEHVDLAIMDLNFRDGMNGMEAAEVIRADGALAHLPLLALTAYAYPDDRRRCLEAGFTDYLSKPVFKQAMRDKVADLLSDADGGDGASSGDPTLWISKK
ncbi:MAG: response regulator [Bacteroidota bacterium]